MLNGRVTRSSEELTRVRRCVRSGVFTFRTCPGWQWKMSITGADKAVSNYCGGGTEEIQV